MIGPADEGRTRHVDYTVHQAYVQLKKVDQERGSR